MRAIVAYLTAKPGMEAKFKEEMTAQAKRCLANEPGCLQFDVAQDPKEPARFVMLEVYKDDAAIKAHTDSEHFKNFRPVAASWSPTARSRCWTWCRTARRSVECRCRTHKVGRRSRHRTS